MEVEEEHMYCGIGRSLRHSEWHSDDTFQTLFYHQWPPETLIYDI
jgi:hypothetical protein